LTASFFAFFAFFVVVFLAFTGIGPTPEIDDFPGGYLTIKMLVF